MPAFASNARKKEKKDKRLFPPALLIALFILLLDQASKIIIQQRLFLNQSIPVVNRVFHFTFVCNRGAAFGLFQGQVFLFIITAAVAVFIIALDLKQNQQKKKRLYQAAMGLLLAGALGNLIDRIFLGCVVDFIDLRVWPVFNLADSALTVGALLLAWHILRPEKKGDENAS